MLAASVLLLALASSATDLFGEGDGRSGSPSSAAPRAVVGAAITGALIAMAALLLHRRHRHGVPALPAHVRRWLPALIALTLAVGALIGASTTWLGTPRERQQREAEEQQRNVEERIEQAQREQRERALDSELHPMDADGDGEPDRDSEGNIIYVADSDGDGRYDSRFVSCESVRKQGGATSQPPTSSPTTPRPPEPEPLPEHGERIPIDVECDGVVDYYLKFDDRLARRFEQEPQALPRVTAPPKPQQPSDNGGNGSAGTVILIVLGVLALLALLLNARKIVPLFHQRSKQPINVHAGETPAAEPAPAAEHLEQVDQTLRSSMDLLRHPDPRVAINEAYGQLLVGFAQSGYPRADHEAPYEHLARCLASVRIDARQAGRLVDLFNLARFSPHPITESHRADALTALESLRASLNQPVVS